MLTYKYDELEAKWQELKRDAAEGMSGMLWRQIDGGHGLPSGVTLSADGEEGLLLTSNCDHKFKKRYKNLRLSVQPAAGGFRIFLFLTDTKLLRYFSVLCASIFTELHKSASQDRASLLEKQLALWESLLKAGKAQLSLEEERGLFGELQILRTLARALSPQKAAEAWTGPLGKPQDFELGEANIEVKSNFENGDSVHISSFEQLDAPLPLYLCVVPLSESPSGYTLRGLVQAVRAVLAEDAAALEKFEEKLRMTGYNEDLEVFGSDKTYSAQSPIWFDACAEGFPSIRASKLPHGILGGGYSISLPALAPFHTEAKI
jgi:hypothetical protein